MTDDRSRKGGGQGQPEGRPPPQRTKTAQSQPRVPVTPPPRTQTAHSNPRVPVTPPPRTQTAHSNPRALVVPPPRTQSAVTNPVAPTVTGSFLAKQLAGAQSAEVAQKQLLQSAFAADDEVTQFDALLGARRKAPQDEPEEATAAGHSFDGTQPADGVTTRDLFKALHPPVQSRPGKRRSDLYLQVLRQFAVAHNPRYDHDAPGKGRGHIFVWDVTRAMGVEIPHFVGGKELTLGSTVDWLRHEGPMRGWRRCDDTQALAAANEGLPVVVIPKEIRIKQMGLVRPGQVNKDGNPPICAAANARGYDLTVNQAFGVFAVEYYLHP